MKSRKDQLLRRCAVQWLFFVLPLLLVGCPPMAEMIEHAGEPTAEVVSTTEPTIQEYQLEPYDGPKARVAVYRFGDRTAKGGGVVHSQYAGGYQWNCPGTLCENGASGDFAGSA